MFLLCFKPQPHKTPKPQIVLANNKNVYKSTLPIFILNICVFIGPFIAVFIIPPMSGVITMEQLIKLTLSVTVLIVGILFIVIPVWSYRFFIKKIVQWDGTDDGLKKSSTAAKQYEIITLLFPLLAALTAPAIAFIETSAAGKREIFTVTAIAFGCIALFSLAFYIPFSRRLEEWMSFLPLNRGARGISFSMRSIFITGLGLRSFVWLGFKT